jgi:hypothetical protein
LAADFSNRYGFRISQLIVIRLMTSQAIGFAASAPFRSPPS